MDQIRAAAEKRILYLPHAIQQMSRGDRMISTGEVEIVVENGELIEEYPDDARGHSGLVLGFVIDKNPIHVVCAPKDEYLAIITAYRPDNECWSVDFKRRQN